MVLVGLYSAFDTVSTMMMGWHKLEIDTFAVYVGFETDEALVVERVKFWVEAKVSDMEVRGSIGLWEFVFAAGFEGFTKDVVAVMIMENH